MNVCNMLALLYCAAMAAFFVAGGINKRTRLIGLGGALSVVYLALQVLV